jgi:hypothetical protein
MSTSFDVGAFPNSLLNYQVSIAYGAQYIWPEKDGKLALEKAGVFM